MAGNATPQFTQNGNIGTPQNVTAANTSSEGGGTIATDIFKIFTADATNGSFVEYVRFIPTATAPTTTTATVGRLFISTVQAGATTNANTHLIAEIVLPAVAADNAASAVNWIDIPLNFRIPAGNTLLVTNHAAPAANSVWKAIPFGGDY